MWDASYTDDKCHCLGGDPRYDPLWQKPGVLSATPEGLEFVADRVEFLEDEEVEKRMWPRSAIIEEVDYEVVPRPADGEGPFDFPAACVVVRDPEGLVPQGFRIRFQFRNEYYAWAFVKYASATLRLRPADGRDAV